MAAVFRSPAILFCQNNGWAISVPTTSQTTGEIWRRAEGYGFPGVRVDGNDVLAVYRVTKDAVARAHAGDGPTLIEALTYRVGPHTTADDAGRYRDDEEVERWRGLDPIARFRTWLLASGHADDAFVSGMRRRGRGGGLAHPRGRDRDRHRRRWSGCSIGRTRTLRHRCCDSARRRSAMPEVTMSAALNAALRDALTEDPRVVVYGQDVGRLGGVFRVSEGLQQAFGAGRVFDTPIAEAGMVGAAVGLALAGWKAVVEIQFDGFSYPALDQVVSHVANTASGPAAVSRCRSRSASRRSAGSAARNTTARAPRPTGSTRRGSRSSSPRLRSMRTACFVWRSPITIPSSCSSPRHATGRRRTAS